MKILFIGNSHTFMNDMPALACEMIENASGQPCEAMMLAYGGRSLRWHMAEEYFSERFNILHGGYDYCVIQEQAHPMTDEADTVEFASRIAELCRKAGTVPVIFETWAEKVIPENQAEMNRRYRKLSSDLGAVLAPIGEVWTAAAAELPDTPETDLYFRDGEHASPLGDYLISMVFAKLFTGKLPSEDFLKALDFTTPGDSWIPMKEDPAEEILYISPETAAVIRKYVDALV